MKVVNHQIQPLLSPSPQVNKGIREPETRQVHRSVLVISYEEKDTKGYSHLKNPYEIRRDSVERALDLRDQEVRLHEKSHFQALGAYAESSIQLGTSSVLGKTRADSGRIKVDLSPVPGNPRATLQKARVLMSAAMSPGSPSGADHKIAAKAYQLQQQAMEEIRQGQG